MRINLWSINYAPELTGIGVYNAQLCEHLLAAGDQVTVVTAFPYYPSWRKSASDARSLFRTDELKGVSVHRCWHHVPRKPKTLSRIFHEASFVTTSFLRQLCLPAPDIYIVVSPPLPLGFAAWILSRLKGRPFVFHVQDLQPDAAVAMDMLKPGPFIRCLYRLERLSYAKAALVTAISPEMVDCIRAKGASRVECFPNGVELPGNAAPTSSGSYKATRGLSPAMHIASYAGNLGIKQGLDLVLAAALRLKDRADVLFVIAGDGADRERLREICEREALTNVRLEPVLPEDEHTSLLLDSDLALITQKPGSGSLFLPSKLLKTLALGRPIVTNAEDESALARACDEGGFGARVAPSDADALARAIVELTADSERRAAMGDAGREYVRRFERGHVLSSFRSLIQSLLNAGGQNAR